MARIFGVDGIRDRVEFFTPELVQKITIGLGRYAGTGVEAKSGAERPMRVLLGGDTRESTEWILRDFEEAFETIGVDHGNAGVLPTPGIKYAFYEMGYDLAVVVAGEDEDYSRNGIQVFERGAKGGVRLGKLGRDFVEEALNKGQALNVQATELAEDLHDDALDLYLTHLVNCATIEGITSGRRSSDLDFIGKKMAGKKIGIDFANGAMSVVGGDVFKKLGAEIVAINSDSKYGKKINDKCGLAYPEELKDLIRKRKLDFGIAFNGDGSKYLIIGKNGEEINVECIGEA